MNFMLVHPAHFEAWTKGHVLHRDISIGNIVLVKESGSDVRRGYLIDWDASIQADEEGRAVEPGRTVSCIEKRVM